MTGAKTKTKAKSKPVSKVELKKVKNDSESSSKSEYRTPIIAVMGHVDHGKTSILDAIRGTEVQASEVGGITQNTRAHMISTAQIEKLGAKTSNPKFTFIDTPGHEAFPEMRKRGARVADIVMLVVAADDGVQPQTKQSAEFIKEAGLPVVIACNKMDLPGANPDKVKQELSQLGILVEEYGGEAVLVPVSAQSGEGLSDLVEAIDLITEMAELKSIPPVQGTAEGFVLESQLHKDLGSLALVVIKSGEIKAGDYLVADGQRHKIRATLAEDQTKTELAIQGQPTWLIGLQSILPVGENILAFNALDEADKLIESIEAKKSEESTDSPDELTDADLLMQLLGEKIDREDTETKLSVVIKADTEGTLQAIVAKLEEISIEGATVNVFEASTGNISEKDIDNAKTVNGIVLGFQVKMDAQAETLAKREKILVRTYEIIYDLIDEVDAVLQSMLSPEEEIEETARALVKQVFTLTNGSQVAGCEVTKGTILKGYRAYVERKGEEVAEGKITSLKQHKNDVKEAKKGSECGIILNITEEILTGDEIVCFKTVR